MTILLISAFLGGFAFGGATFILIFRRAWFGSWHTALFDWRDS